MAKKNKQDKMFSRRVFVLVGLKLSLLATLVARLYYLQIVKSSEYKTFSDSNRIKLFLIPPLRGKLLDRNGLLLAGNQNYYRALLDPESSGNKVQTMDFLANVLKLDKDARTSLIEKVKAHKSMRPLTVYEHLTWEQVASVEVNAPDLPGVSIDVGHVREFPTREISSHVLGYMGPVSEQELKQNPLLNHPDFKIGRDGVERALEKSLRGTAGVKKMEVNAHGLVVRELGREKSLPGADVKLTLDRRMQEFIGKRLEGLSGCCVLLSIETGEILGLVSTPGFDPHEFTYGVSRTYWKKLMDDVKKPLINKALSNQYPPGSTFKLVVSLAALKEGVDPTQKIFCPGYMDLGRTRFRCWKEGGHGWMDMPRAIMHSCNTFFYHTSKRLGLEPIENMARYFGLGKETGLMLSAEKPGLVPSEKWKKKKYKDEWHPGDTLNVGIGQGYVLATPVQLALLSARIAGGKMVLPTLVGNDNGDIGPHLTEGFRPLDIPTAHLDLVRGGMISVVNEPGGTAYGSRIQDPLYSMAGKTGTSQVISKKGLESVEHSMTPEELELTKNHALFVGFGPIAAPKYAISVIIEHGGGGSKAAAPVAKDVMHEVQRLEV